MTPDVTGEFQVMLTGLGPYDYLDVNVERGERVRAGDLEALKRRVETRLKETLSFTARVALIQPHSIARTEMGKTSRLVRTG